MPTLHNPGLHVIALDGSGARWLGPGMDPAFTPDGREVLVQAAHAAITSLPGGPLYAVDVRSRSARVVSDGGNFAAAKPSPSGRYVAVVQIPALGRELSLVVLAANGRRVGTPQPLGLLRPDLRDGFGWQGAADTLQWRNGEKVQRLTLPDGKVEAVTEPVTAPAPPETAKPKGLLGELVLADGKAYGIVADETGRKVVRSDPATGEVTVLAAIDPLVPVADPLWPGRPAVSPDGKQLVVSLGRTDRWGLQDSDDLETTDTDGRGTDRKVVRRLRDVAPSGAVFDSRQCRFGGQATPKPDSSVVGDARPGGMRWQRPSPARWVVLHHTSANSDSGCLNSLTSETEWKLAGLYEDITPGAWLPTEPRTLSVHYLVFRSGTVCQLVEEQYIARHAGTGQWANRGPIYDFNAETIGIEIVSVGNDYTDGQVQNVGKLVADICRRHEIPFEHIPDRGFTEGVLYHKDFADGLRGKPDPSGWPWDRMEASGRAWLARTR